MKKYDPKNIEPKWQQVWADTKLYQAVTGDPREKYYMLTEFPYPSGAGVHAGHTREYTIGDVISRHKRMQGFNVLYPMGFDAFGLPTENYAIKHKIRPQDATAQNIATFRQQFDSLGLGFDWDRAVNTTDPDYYRWTQWLFLKFYEAGLAYQAEMAINWCPKEKTGLANEEVVDGKHERCGTPVEKKLIKQWMLKITAYADRLIDGLKDLDFPPRIADQQVNWIGRSEGAEIDFPVEGETITAYTTRPDTLGGATFLVLAPEHPAVAKITSDPEREQVEAYVRKAQSESEIERQNTDRKKTGVFTGAYAKNPITGDKMPVWVADYVLAGYGTGAIMAVPAHDDRDAAFAKAFDLPIKPVVQAPANGKAALILHGASGNSHENWIPWLKDQLEVFGYEVITPDLPDSQHPDLEAWLQALESYASKLNEHSVIVTHSLGTPTAAQFIVRNKLKVGKFLAVAPSFPDRDWDQFEKDNKWESVPGIKAISLAPLDHEAFMAAIDSIVVFSSDDDPYIPYADLQKYLATKLPGAKLVGFTGRGHFSKNAGGITTLPEAVPVLVDEFFTGTGALINSGEFDGLTGAEAKKAVTGWLKAKGIGRHAKKYKLRDWIFSRQHYWGEPIPIVHCPHCIEKADITGRVVAVDVADPSALENLAAGAKNVITRALGPNASSSDYATVKAGDVLELLMTGEKPKLFARVKAARRYKSLEELYEDELTTRSAFGKKFKDAQDLAQQYEKNRQGYAEQIKQFGLVAWDVEVLKAAVPVPEDQLPVTLPEVEHYEPTDDGRSPLAAVTDWVNTTCPQCGGPAQRETDTMPNWAGSSWYYLRYTDAHNDQAFASPEAMKYWLPVDLYLGGMEHTTLHLLYSRFWHEFFYDQGLVPTPEPYAARRGQGIVLAADNRKMSKSIGNVINPTDIIATHGADTLRLYILFMAPYDETTPWSEDRLNGASRFVYRVWALAQELIDAHGGTGADGRAGSQPPAKNAILGTQVDRMTHKTIKKIHDELGEMRFNTAVSALMEYVNFLTDAKIKQALLQPDAATIAWRSLRTLILLLAPMTPHISEELWHEIGEEGSVHVAGWPAYDPELIKDDIVNIVVQVNGKVRSNLAMPVGATDDELTAAAQADEKVAKYLAEGKIVKTIVVSRKLVNFVVK